MAEYYSLLERAVAGLQDASPASRRAIYDRARNALLGQLRAMQPPVPEVDIQRESAALDQAIARLEERIGKEKPRPAASGPPSPPAVPTGEQPAAPPGFPVGTAPAVPPPKERERPVLAPRVSAPPVSRRVSAPAAPPAPAGSVKPERQTPSSPVPARMSGPGARTGSATEPVGKIEQPLAPPGAMSFAHEPAPATSASTPEPSAAATGSAPGSSPPTGPSPVLPTAPTLAVPMFINPPQDESSGASGAQDSASERAPNASARQGRDGSRPAAPRPAAVEPRTAGVYVVACLAFLLVLGIAIAAWKLRDRPDQVTAARTESSSPETPGKIVDRVTGDGGSAPSTGPEPSGDAAAIPAPIPQSGEQPAAASAPSDAAPAVADATASTPAIPVSQRAALLVDAPEDPQKIKTYVGSVVWRSESVSPSQDQPLSTAVRGEVEIPDAKLTMSMVLKKNLEAQFPASHTMEFHFTELPGNTLGPIRQISVPEMRKDDSASTGDPLTGVPVSITDDYFLVGLSRGGAETPNMRMMTDRNWVDVAVIYKSGKVAKITFEKGTSGQQVFEDALKSWQ